MATEKLTRDQLRSLVREEIERHKRVRRLVREGRLSSTQAGRLEEAGFFQKIVDFFGAASDTVTGDLKKVFQNNKVNRRAATAKKNIQKEIEELKAIAKEAGVSEDAVMQMLNLTFKDAGVDPTQVSSAPVASTRDEDEAETAAPAKPLAPDSKASVAPLAAAAAQAAGQDPQKAQQQAAEKGIDVPKVTQVLAKAVASSAGTPVELTGKVIDWLMKNKHMQAEGGRALDNATLLEAAREAAQLARGSRLQERWGMLAGLPILEEAAPEKPAQGAAEKLETAKKQFSEFWDAVLKALGVEDDQEAGMQVADVLIALDALDAVELA